MDKTIVHKVPSRNKIVSALRLAFKDCGYDLDEVMLSRTKPRLLSDLRTIAWSIYQSELHRTYKEIAKAFGWSRATVYCALRRERSLYTGDKVFRDISDRIWERFSERRTDEMLS